MAQSLNVSPILPMWKLDTTDIFAWLNALNGCSLLTNEKKKFRNCQSIPVLLKIFVLSTLFLCHLPSHRSGDFLLRHLKPTVDGLDIQSDIFARHMPRAHHMYAIV